MVKREWKNRKKSEVIDFNGIRYYRYPESKSHGKRCYYTCSHENKQRGYNTLHRDMWIAAYGEIPEGYSVHHKDGNYLNNTLENFELLTKSEHLKRHWAMQPEEKREMSRQAIKKAQKRNQELFKNNEYREYRRKLAKQIQEGLSFQCVCQICGKTFTSHCAQTKFCSEACRKEASKQQNKRKYKEKQEYRTCIVCGKQFKTFKYSIAQTCSPHCKNIKRGRTIHSL